MRYLTSPSVTRVTGAVLLLELLLLVVPNFVLEAVFEFPDILRQPADYVLTLFRENQATIVPTYYAFALSGVLFAVVALLLAHVLKPSQPSALLRTATLFGVLTAIVQFLGFIRWPFLVPELVRVYFDPASSEATRAAVLVVHEAFNRYAGVAVGENLGFVFTGVWLVLLGVYLAGGRSLILKPWTGYAAITLGVLVLVGTLEQFGFEPPVVSLSFFVGYGGFVTALLVLGVTLLFRRGLPVSGARA